MAHLVFKQKIEIMTFQCENIFMRFLNSTISYMTAMTIQHPQHTDHIHMNSSQAKLLHYIHNMYYNIYNMYYADLVEDQKSIIRFCAFVEEKLML